MSRLLDWQNLRWRQGIQGEWKRRPESDRTSASPAETYQYQLDDGGLRFERSGRIWRAFLDPTDGSPTMETSAAENIGKVARELKEVLADWQAS